MLNVQETIAPGPIRQIGIFVPDPLAAAKEHLRRFGSGPWFVTDPYRGFNHVYRGEKGEDMELMSCLGQFGNVMIEFTTQVGKAPSAYWDAFPNGGPGIHHFAFLVDDARSEIARIEALGFAVAGRYQIDDSGYDYTFIDTRDAFGVMTEIYERSYLEPFYNHLRDSAEGWDGSDPIRYLGATSSDPRITLE
jgi:hypothetical protein